MNDDLDWTWALGEAVLANQADVIDAVQTFRDRAYAAGNLRSDDRQVVTAKSGVIEIAPANPEVVYIPYYEPRRVVVYQPTPAYYYYPRAYPLYYYPYPIGYSFSSPFFWGVTSAFTIGWHTHFVHVHHHSDFGHPYYRNQYYSYTPYYRRSGAIVNVNVNRVSNVWQPNERRASRPLRNNGGAARVVIREDGSVRRSPNGATRVATTPSQRTIGGVATRNSLQQRTVPQGTAQRRVTGPNSGEIARELRNSAANRSTNAPQAGPANPPQRAIQPRVATGTPQRAEGTGKALQQRTIGGTATRKLPQRTAAPPAAAPRAKAPDRSNAAARALRVAPARAPANAPPRSGGTMRPAAPANNSSRFAAPPREAARSGGTARPAPAQQRPVQREARQTTRR
jgi:hypothetical protein